MRLRTSSNSDLSGFVGVLSAMPQPFKGTSGQFGPNTILQRPDLAAHIGNVCASWALVEYDMVSLYALLMGSYLPAPEPGWSPPAHPVAFQIFDALNALAPRIDLLERLCKWRATPQESEHFERTLKPEIRSRFRERSIVAHGLWAINKDEKDALILVNTFGENHIYKAHDFEQISTRILELHRKLGDFTHPIYERHQAK